MTEKRPLRLPAWVVMVCALLGAVVMVPTAFWVYAQAGYTDRGAMQVMGLMLVPMLPFVGVSLWKGLEMPDDTPPMKEDLSRTLVVGERRRRPFADLSPEGAALAVSALGGSAAPALWLHYGLVWAVLAAISLALGGVAAAAWFHIRRVNRSDDD